MLSRKQKTFFCHPSVSRVRQKQLLAGRIPFYSPTEGASLSLRGTFVSCQDEGQGRTMEDARRGSSPSPE